MDQGRYVEEKYREERSYQGGYGTQVESWVCPACETVNTQDKCVVCGYQNKHKVDTIVSEKKRRPSPALAIAACFVAVFFLVLFMWPGQSIAELPQNNNAGQMTETEEVVQETAMKVSYTLMADPLPPHERYDYGYTYPVFGSKYLRQQITSITFLSSTEDSTVDSWDVSENQNGTVLAWVKPNGNRDNLELFDLYIGAEGGIQAPENCAFLFGSYCNLQRIDFNEVFDTANVTDMYSMFFDCSRLTELDVSGFDTAKVTNMAYMFSFCERLIELDVSGFDTANVIYMWSMFSDCIRLTELDVSGFDTANVIYMGGMFAFCNSLTELDVSGFDTANVTEMYSMFLGCSSLTKLDVSGFDTANVTDMSSMFDGCSSLTELDVSGFDTSNVKDMHFMFSECNCLTELDVSGFDVSNVEEYYDFMDNGCRINGRPWEEFFDKH